MLDKILELHGSPMCKNKLQKRLKIVNLKLSKFLLKRVRNFVGIFQLQPMLLFGVENLLQRVSTYLNK